MPSQSSPAPPPIAAAAAERPKLGRLALDLLRHAWPLAWLYLFHGDTGIYLLLTAFDLSLGLLLVVGMTPDAKPTPTPQGRLPWVFGIPVLAIFLALIAALITIPIGMPVIIFGFVAGTEWSAIFASGGFWISVALMALLASTRALVGQAAFDRELRAGMDEATLRAARAGAKADYAAQVTLIAGFLALVFLFINLSALLFYVLPPAFAALQLVYDARPDWIRRIFPELWQQKTGDAITPSTSDENDAPAHGPRRHRAGRPPAKPR